MEGFHSHLSKKNKDCQCHMIFCSPKDERRSNQNHFSFKSFTNIRRPYPSLSAFRSTPVNMVLHVLSIRKTSVVMLRPWTCVQHYSHQLTKFWWFISFISFICYDLDILWSKHGDSTIPSILHPNAPGAAPLLVSSSVTSSCSHGGLVDVMVRLRCLEIIIESG